MNKMDIDRFSSTFSALADRKLIEEILDLGNIIEVPPDTEILKCGQLIEQIPLVLKGTVKVMKVHEGVKEVLLYFINPGETCVMTLSSCLKKQRSIVKAISYDPSVIITLPVNHIYSFMRRYPSWNEFILHAYRHRFGEIVDAFERRSFQSVEQQVLGYLNDLANNRGSKTLIITHRTIADDLATSRVVVSRTLKALEREKLLVLSRNQIRLL